MSENKKLTKAAGVVGAATLLSRICGYIRDMVFAAIFGAGLYSDAFIAAFRIPNTLRRLFGEGSLSIAFIPVFTEYLATKGKEEAFSFAGSAVRMLSALLVIITLLGVLFSPLIIRVVAPGFSDSPEKFSLTVALTRLMFPYIFFIGLVALAMGILNAVGHFAAPAVAPACLNLSMIAAMFVVWLFTEDPTARIYGLGFGVLIGGVLQLILQMPFLIKQGGYFWKKVKIYHAGLKKIGVLMLPAILGSAVYQINILVGTLLASLLPEGSVSYLYYADRLVQFPLGIFGIAMATAVLPSLSRQAALKDDEALRDTFAYAMNLIFFITLPSMTGLIVLREPITALLFQRGAFDIHASRLTADALLYYCAGLWAFSAVRIVVSTFYALQDTKTPVKTAIISIAANIILGIILMKPLQHSGLALATSLSSILNLCLLVWALKSKIGILKWRNILKSTCKSVIASVIMGVIVWGISNMMIPSEQNSMFVLLSGVVVSISAGVFIYGIISYMLKTSEIELIKMVMRRLLR